mmetsp:Transcript_34150/g.94148  ORF Transcript_34150/g.94148 Transcript_34150/m.94148 type:complete len:258 (-) Transcript_34150:61-834(-)
MGTLDDVASLQRGVRLRSRPIVLFALVARALETAGGGGNDDADWRLPDATHHAARSQLTLMPAGDTAATPARIMQTALAPHTPLLRSEQQTAVPAVADSFEHEVDRLVAHVMPHSVDLNVSQAHDHKPHAPAVPYAGLPQEQRELFEILAMALKIPNVTNDEQMASFLEEIRGSRPTMQDTADFLVHLMAGTLPIIPEDYPYGCYCEEDGKCTDSYKTPCLTRKAMRSDASHGAPLPWRLLTMGFLISSGWRSRRVK